MARILCRSGVYVSAMPPVAPTLAKCRLCIEHERAMDYAMRALDRGRHIEAVGLAEDQTRMMENHSCDEWQDTAFWAPRRGRFFSVRLEKGYWDYTLQEDYRLPIARADCVMDDDERPRVVHAPFSVQEGRVAHWFLSGLDQDEVSGMMSDLVER